MKDWIFYSPIVEYWDYRQAQVLGGIRFDFKPSQYFCDLLAEYLQENGHRLDNHICFKTEDGLYVQVSDYMVIIGTTIKVGSW